MDGMGDSGLRRNDGTGSGAGMTVVGVGMTVVGAGMTVVGVGLTVEQAHPLGSHHSIADVFDGAEVGSAARFQLVAEAADMDIHGAGAADIFYAPYAG